MTKRLHKVKQEGYSQGFNEGSRQGYEENVQALQKKATEFDRLLESLSEPFKVLDAEVEKELVKLAIGYCHANNTQGN